MCIGICDVRGMSLKFVDSLSTAKHKQLLVFSAISFYSVMYQEYKCEQGKFDKFISPDEGLFEKNMNPIYLTFSSPTVSFRS